MQNRNMMQKQSVDRSISWLISGNVDGRAPLVILGVSLICVSILLGNVMVMAKQSIKTRTWVLFL
jgi:hypothetical protein